MGGVSKPAPDGDDRASLKYAFCDAAGVRQAAGTGTQYLLVAYHPSGSLRAR